MGKILKFFLLLLKDIILQFFFLPIFNGNYGELLMFSNIPFCVFIIDLEFIN